MLYMVSRCILLLGIYSRFKINLWDFIWKREIKDEYLRFFSIVVKEIQTNYYDYRFSAYAYDKVGNVAVDEIRNPHTHLPLYYYLQWII
jgi:hypothetical protein